MLPSLHKRRLTTVGKQYAYSSNWSRTDRLFFFSLPLYAEYVMPMAQSMGQSLGNETLLNSYLRAAYIKFKQVLPVGRRNHLIPWIPSDVTSLLCRTSVKIFSCTVMRNFYSFCNDISIEFYSYLVSWSAEKLLTFTFLMLYCKVIWRLFYCPI